MSKSPSRCSALEVLTLPCHLLDNVSLSLEDTWNIRRMGWGGKNENNTIETEPGEGPVLCVAFPQGSINPSSAPQRPLGGLGFYAAPKAIFPAHDVELHYKLKVSRHKYLTT